MFSPKLAARFDPSISVLGLRTRAHSFKARRFCPRLFLDPGDFLDHLTEMEYDLLTAEPAVSPSEVTEDVPPAKIKRFSAVPSSEELVALSRFEVPRNTARSTQWAVKVLRSWAEEHYNLKISQMQRFENPPRYEYTELVSKNRAGGLASYRLKNKVVPVFQDESLGKQCHVYVLDLYLSKIPSSARAQDVFYLRPKPVNMEDDNPWYSSQRIGRNRISQLMKTICSGSGVQNKYTNHSLRATGATRLFQSGTPENVIMERSGHRSTDGVRQYEQVSQDQHIAAQAILTARDGFRAYDAELQSV